MFSNEYFPLIPAIVAIFIVLVTLAICYIRRKKNDLRGEHVLITGGSSGIGLALAHQAAKFGAHVTLVARSQTKLNEAAVLIRNSCQKADQNISTYSFDLSKQSNELKKLVLCIEEKSGPITMLINCAGTSIASRFEDTPASEFSAMLNINYLGSIYMAQAVMPLMKQRGKGRIVFVSSLAGLIGLYGYTAYSGSKFAVFGAAQALQMEAKPYNISITVSFPPDTDTPGFAEEIKQKPIETMKISESGGLFSPERVAAQTMQDALAGRFMSSVGFEGWMLCNVCSGATPVGLILDLFFQVITMPLFRLAMFIYHLQCERTIKKCQEKKSS